MNASEDIQSSLALQGTCDSEIRCVRESSAKCENEPEFYVSKNGSLSENCKSVNTESASTELPECYVISDGDSKRNSNIILGHHTAVAKEFDGGWGWVIVFCVFFVTSLLGGINVSLSLLYLEFVDMFDASSLVIGWIGSLHLFMAHVIGNSNSCLVVTYVIFV